MNRLTMPRTINAIIGEKSIAYEDVFILGTRLRKIFRYGAVIVEMESRI